MIQKSLSITVGAEKESLVAAVKKCIPNIPDKKIRKKWEKIILEASEAQTNDANLFSESETTRF